jgi:ADP-ribose pyrophosphatase YjhB (NUDIX family)
MLMGVNVAIIQDGKVLLTRREDYEVWCLPGGHSDDNESLAQGAIREVREETGLDVQLTRLVGIYSRPGWNNGGYHIVVFAGEVSGGTLQADPHEVLEIAYFDPADLPPLLLGQRQRILDACAGYGGSVAYCEAIQYPSDVPNARLDVYRDRDQSGLSRQEYYRQHFDSQDVPGTVEIEGREL